MKEERTFSKLFLNYLNHFFRENSLEQEHFQVISSVKLVSKFCSVLPLACKEKMNIMLILVQRADTKEAPVYKFHKIRQKVDLKVN